MTEKKLLIIMVASFVIILLVAIIFFSVTNVNAPQVITTVNAKAYTLDATSADWGQIPMYKGDVFKTFRIKNNGTETLKIFNIKTSCHCTKAYLKIGTSQSPYFGMSGISDYVGQIAPGEKADLVVDFDPAYHGPNGVGPITRYVSVETNDKANPNLTFTITGNVYK